MSQVVCMHGCSERKRTFLLHKLFAKTFKHFFTDRSSAKSVSNWIHVYWDFFLLRWTLICRHSNQWWNPQKLVLNEYWWNSKSALVNTNSILYLIFRCFCHIALNNSFFFYKLSLGLIIHLFIKLYNANFGILKF